MLTSRLSSALVLVLALSAPSLAQEQRAVEQMVDEAIDPAVGEATSGFAIYGGGAIELSYEEYGQGTGGSISGEAYMEAELQGFYLGVWAMATDEETDNEIDLYFGYRNSLDSGFSYDIGYARYYYPNDGWDCCGEITLGLYTPVGDKVGLGLDLAYDPDNEVGNAYVYGEFYATDSWTISANYGSYEVVDASSETEWDFGATYAIGDETGVDLRWYDGSEYDGYFALSLAFDTTIFER